MSTERHGRFRIERVCDEARVAGYGHAWHVFDDNDQDPYVGTFPTREDARHHVRQALAVEALRFIAVPVPSGRYWTVRDTVGRELRCNGRPTSVLSWDGMSEETARRIAARYNDGFRPS